MKEFLISILFLVVCLIQTSIAQSFYPHKKDKGKLVNHSISVHNEQIYVGTNSRDSIVNLKSGKSIPLNFQGCDCSGNTQHFIKLSSGNFLCKEGYGWGMYFMDSTGKTGESYCLKSYLKRVDRETIFDYLTLGGYSLPVSYNDLYFFKMGSTSLIYKQEINVRTPSLLTVSLKDKVRPALKFYETPREVIQLWSKYEALRMAYDFTRVGDKIVVCYAGINEFYWLDSLNSNLRLRSAEKPSINTEVANERSKYMNYNDIVPGSYVSLYYHKNHLIKQVGRGAMPQKLKSGENIPNQIGLRWEVFIYDKNGVFLKRKLLPEGLAIGAHDLVTDELYLMKMDGIYLEYMKKFNLFD